MSEISERVATLVKSSGLSIRQVALKAGLSPMTITGWLNGRNEPTIQGAKKFANLFKVNPSWIMFGDAEDYEVSSKISLNTISIPMYDVEASCGGGSYIPSAYEPVAVRYIGVNESFIKLYCRGVNPKKLVLLRANGDSMEPTINDGDPCIVDISQKEVRSDGIYALNYSGQLFIKRILIKPNGRIVIISDNAAYPPVEIGEQDHVEIFGRVYAAVFVKSLTGIK